MDFARLAHTFEELETTNSRLALIGLLTELFRSIDRPEEVQQACYLVQGRVAPFYVAQTVSVWPLGKAFNRPYG